MCVTQLSEEQMTIKITTLSENTAGGDPDTLNWFFMAEFALSILVEVDGQNILFDTGLDQAAVHNARLLGIDLSLVDKIVLSHAHEDHTGGLRDVLKATGQVEVIAHPDIWDIKYGGNQQMKRYVGVPFRREELERLGARFNLTKDPVWITDHVVTTGEVPMVTDYEQIDPMLLVKKGDTFCPDLVADDLSLVIKSDKGLVVILGCAHRGMINHIRHAQNLTRKKNIHTIIGGTHLMAAAASGLDRTITDLKQMKVTKLGACHCTGFEALSRLYTEFPDAFFLNNAGTQIKI